MRGGRLTIFGTSAVIHVGIAAVLAYFAVEHVRKDPPPMYLDMELAPLPTRAVTRPEPAAEPPPPDPEATPRPDEVPKETRVVKTERPVPFAPAILDSGDRQAPDDVDMVHAPTTTMTFDMEQNVGGGAGDYISSSIGGGMPVAPGGRGGPGAGGGAPGQRNVAGRTDLEVARDWQVTVLPKPLNDRDFEPDYPTLARREAREAVVVLELAIDSSGKVAGAAVLKGPSEHGFRRAAIAYARKLRFEPARAGAQPVAARIEWTVYFYVRN